MSGALRERHQIGNELLGLVRELEQALRVGAPTDEVVSLGSTLVRRAAALERAYRDDPSAPAVSAGDTSSHHD
ncbi:MAG: hypothetical protein IPJ65_24320 [Archangiaceae bacterium]|nr:hypothetical protein [Archangiaceae bacterium]